MNLVSRQIKRLALFIAFGLLLAAAGCAQSPQIGNDDRVYRELDAMYTALTARRADLLDDCRDRLAALNQSQVLPEPALKTLNQIADRGHGGEWETAAAQLHRFIRAQRRSKG